MGLGAPEAMSKETREQTTNAANAVTRTDPNAVGRNASVSPIQVLSGKLDANYNDGTPIPANEKNQRSLGQG